MNIIPHVEAVLEELVAANRKTLGDKLLAYYLYGSYMTGDFTIGTSDLDMSVVLTDELDERDLDNLKRMHEQFAVEYPAFDGRIETQYVSQKALQTFRTVRHPMANISPGEPFHLIEGGDEWLSNWWMILNHGRTLYGPTPEEVIPPIADEEFFDVIRLYVEEAREWGKKYTSLPGQSYTMLTMFRALYTLTHREHTSKLKAARWAQKQYPQYAEMIEKAVYWREHHAEAADDPAATHQTVMEIVEFACAEIQRI